MKRTITIFFLLTSFFVRAQAPLGIPSPNNSFLNTGSGGNGEVGVDLYSGVAQVIIPLASAQGRDVSIPVSLSYTGGRGIRVQDYASNVGLGWQLSAGGRITRVVRGLPDENSQGYIGSISVTNEWGKKIANHFRIGTSLPSQVTGGTGGGMPTADGEPDLFYISTPFFSFSFVFDENGSPIFSNANGIQIIDHIFYGSSTSSEGYGFTVIDQSGNTYYFGGTATYKESITSKLLSSNQTYVSTWYLNKIVTFNSKETINFSYVSSPSNAVLYHYTASITRNALYGNWGTPKNETHTTTITQPKQISSIRTNVSEITFSYAFDRLDIPNAARLTGVMIRSRTSSSGSEILRTYNLHHDYFNPSGGVDMKRLKLHKITLTGSGPGAPYPLTYREFGYYTDKNLPSRTGNEFDYWGYHTAISYVVLEPDPLKNPAQRSPNLSETKANVLTTIQGMAGAVTQINYQLNTFLNSSNTNTTVGGLRVSSIVVTDPGNQSLTTSYDYNSAGKSTGRITSDSYGNLTVFGSTYPMYVNFSESLSNIYDINGTFIGYSGVKTIFPTGGYSITSFTNFDEFPDDHSTWSGIGGQPPNVASVSSYAYKRGLPKSVKVYTNTGSPIAVDSFEYNSLTSPVQRTSYAIQKLGWQMAIDGMSEWFVGTYWYATNVGNHRLVRKISRSYDQVNPSLYLETIDSYSYSSNLHQVRTISSTDSKGIAKTRTIHYSWDTPSGIPMIDAGETTAVSQMKQRNNIGAVVHEKAAYNGKNSEAHHSFTVAGSNIYNTRSRTFSDGIAVEDVSSSYDAARNNVSVKPQYGTPTIMIYSYNNTYPIAEIQNAEYATVVAALGGQTAVNNFAANYAPTATQVATFLAPLRTATSLAGALVTTYAYESGVGIVSKTDPLGKKITYEYDGLQRLIRIKDHNGKIVEDYQYNYKPNY